MSFRRRLPEIRCRCPVCTQTARRYSSYKEGRGCLPAPTRCFMKITYTGRQVELAPAQLKKLQGRFTKIGKLLDGREERDAHVVLSLERKIHKAEATIHYYNHEFVGVGSNADLFTAINLATEKLEKQCLKTRTKS